MEIAKEVMGTDEPTTNGIYDRADADVLGHRPVRAQGAGGARQSFVEMKTLPAEPDMSKLYTEAFLPRN